MAFCGILMLIGVFATATAAVDNTTDIPSCLMSCKKVTSAPQLFSNHAGPLPTVIPFCSLNTTQTKSRNRTECNVDIKDVMALNHVSGAAVFYFKLFCSDKYIRVRFLNAENLQNADSIGYLWIVGCKIHWEDIAVFSKALKVKVLFLQNFEDQWVKESNVKEKWIKEANSSGPHNLSLVTKSLRQIGTVGLFILKETDHFPSIFTSFIWPLLAEIEIHSPPSVRVFENTDLQTLQQTMPHLQSIELSGGALDRLPKVFPWDQKDLKLPANLSRSAVGNDHYAKSHGLDLHEGTYRRVLFINDNNITDLSNYQFTGRLMKIRIQNCKLQYLGNNTFSRVTGLQSLDLSKNKISVLPSQVFSTLTNLSVLSIADNKLQFLPDDLFDKLLSLTQLSLSGNGLINIQSGLCGNLQSLISVDISRNRINRISDTAINANQETVTEINFSANKLKSIPNLVFLLRNLANINLSKNNITFKFIVEGLRKINAHYILFHNRESASSFSPTVQSPSKSKSVNLSYNNITTIDLSLLDEQAWNTFAHILLFFNLDLRNNGFNCDCKTYEFFQFLHGMDNIPNTPVKNLSLPKNPFYTENLQCFQPQNVRGIQLYNLDNQDFKCAEDMENCPAECVCHRRSIDKSVIVDCTNRSLTDLPKHVPTGTKIVNFSKNALQVLDVVPDYIPNLEVLLLDHNEIDFVSPVFLKTLYKSILLQLSLQYNKLQTLPEEIKYINVRESLKLSNNPWQCDCHNKWMKDFLIIHRSIVPDLDFIVCVTGKPEGKVLIEAPLEDFVCITRRAIILRNSLVTLGIFVLLILVLICIVYKYGSEIKILLCAHFNWHPFHNTEETEVIDMNYDVFISYSGLDYKWVCFDLLKKIEQHDPPYRACLHDRDFMPGTCIEDSIMEAVQTSRRMVLVLSNNYLQSDWCMLEFRAAHNKVLNDRTNYLIVVLYDDVDMDSLDEDLKLYIRTNAYLSVSNTWFYDKLFYAMPQKTLSQLKQKLSQKKKDGNFQSSELIQFSRDHSVKSDETSVTNMEMSSPFNTEGY